MTFFDVHRFHASCKTYIGRPVNRISANQGTEKRRSFNERILRVERGNFTPLVFGLPGGCGYETHKLIKTGEESAKTGEECSSVIRDLRTVVSGSPEGLQQCQRCPLSRRHAAVVDSLLLRSLSLWMYIFFCSYNCCDVVSFLASFLYNFCDFTISVIYDFFKYYIIF